MSNLTDTISHFSVTEKVQYALKTALFRTMQTAFGDSGASEKAAPPRIFPNNIMKVNLVDVGKGDIDEDGYYASRAMGTGYAHNGKNDLVDLEAVELIVAKYRIINPSNNVITTVRVETLAGDEAAKTQAQINAMPTSGQTYPWKNWFFRGHYGSGTDAVKYAAANATYDGLQLAWDKATAGNVAAEADIVPHLKYYLQVQTDYTSVSDENSTDNITYIHDKMKGLLGLDQNFVTTISVNMGEGGGCSWMDTTGKSVGEYWFTQATSGTLSFYGVGNSGTDQVTTSNSLSNLSATKFPMVSFVRYVGETGFGEGTGGGGAGATPEQTITEVPTWDNLTLTTQGLGVFKGKVTATSMYISGDNTKPTSVTGAYNITLGILAGSSMTTGNNNAFLGFSAGKYVGNGGQNIGIGSYACGGAASANGTSYNICFGYNAGRSIAGGANNIVMGQSAGYTISTGLQNIFFGQLAGQYTGIGIENIYIGLQSGQGNVAGGNNICIGTQAGQNKTDKNYMIAIGKNALNSNMGGAQCIAIGIDALKGVAGNNHYDNIAIGYQAMRGVTTATNCVVIGYDAGVAITSGGGNVLVGNYCGKSISTGAGNVCIGRNCGEAALNAASAVYIGDYAGQHASQQNIGIGFKAMHQNAGSHNVAFGYHACKGGSGHAGRNGNICLGYGTLEDATSASYSVAIGHSAAQNITTGMRNILIGYQTGVNMTTCDDNICIGDRAGYNITGANNDANDGRNIAIGRMAMYGSNAGSQNISIGDSSMYNGTSADNNVAIGKQTLFGITSGAQNVAIGYRAGHNTSTGINNVYVGYEAGQAMTGSTSCVFIGYKAGRSTYVEANTAVGYEALYTSGGGYYNTAIGYRSCYGGTGNSNVGVGIYTLHGKTSGGENTAIGTNSQRMITTGNYNNSLGRASLYNNKTGHNNISIGANSGGKIAETGNSYRLYIGSQSDNDLYRGVDSFIYGDMTVGSEKLVFNANVGIGTTSPSQLLHIFNSSTSWGAYANIRLSTDTNNGNTNYGEIGYFRGTNSSADEGLVFSGRNASRKDMVILSSNGRCGIGTTNPAAKLEVFDCAYGKTNTTPTKPSCMIYGDHAGETLWIGHQNQTSGIQIGYDTIKKWGTNDVPNGHLYFNISGSNDMTIVSSSGNVGIGTNTPTALLHVATSTSHSSSEFTSGYYIRSYPSGGGASSSAYTYSSTWSTYTLSILAEGGIYAKTGYIVASDRRIKENIVDVPDNLALEMVRKIPCRYYEYKDKNVRGSNKTIGFIAQEIKEVLPMAVTIQTEIIPNEMRKLEDISWDISENIYKLNCDLQDCSGIKYRFYVSNDPSGNDEKKEDIVGNPDNTFSFDSSYNNVFCYGKEVNDFHTLDKQKIFTLHHSAIQEIDRKQLADEVKIASLENKVTSLETKNATLETKMTSLESELAAIKTHLGI